MNNFLEFDSKKVYPTYKNSEVTLKNCRNCEGCLAETISTAKQIVRVLGVRNDLKSGKTVNIHRRFIWNDQSGTTK